MTSYRDSTQSQFQTHIDSLVHSSITSKLSVIDDLNDELVVEQTALEAQRNQLHQHKQLVAELTTDLKGIQAGEEYTTAAGSGILPTGKVVYVDASYSGGSDSGSREKPYASLEAAIIAKCGVADSTERIFDIASGEYTRAND